MRGRNYGRANIVMLDALIKDIQNEDERGGARSQQARKKYENHASWKKGMQRWMDKTGERE